ncbi:MAG: hypothetical protein ACYS1C_10240 [Planctomycetota bacterium]|jgi:hypothetical protein
MRKALRYLGQLAFYAATAAMLGYFADSPVYTHVPSDKALIKLSFAHGAGHKGECRRRSAEELAELAPNMRQALDCPRERLPVLVELNLDGEPLYHATLPPTGLAKDGPARVYERFVVTPGTYRLSARMRDSARTEGFDYESDFDLALKAGQNLVIDFRSETGGFLLK